MIVQAWMIKRKIAGLLTDSHVCRAVSLLLTCAFQQCIAYACETRAWGRFFSFVRDSAEIKRGEKPIRIENVLFYTFVHVLIVLPFSICHYRRHEQAILVPFIVDSTKVMRHYNIVKLF